MTIYAPLFTQPRQRSLAEAFAVADESVGKFRETSDADAMSRQTE